MADTQQTLDKAGALIQERLREIEDERRRLEAALANLNVKQGGAARRALQGGGRKRRRRKGGTRAEHALAQIAANPGIQASEIADRLGIKANYVYRVMADLKEDGKVVKKGRGYELAPGVTA